MKKTIFILIVAIFCLQNAGLSQKTRVGITGGLSLADMRGTVNGTDQKGDNLKLGYTFGLIVDAPLMDHLTFQPGLHYVQKGKRQDLGADTKMFTALQLAELQLNFLYNTTSDGTIIFVGAGPAFSVNLPSKTVTKIGDTKTETDITFGNKTENFRAFDFGANFFRWFFVPIVFFLFFFTSSLEIIFLPPVGSGIKKKKNFLFFVRFLNFF